MKIQDVFRILSRHVLRGAAVLLALAPFFSAAADLASHALLLDGALVGNDLVAVGERGTILRTADQGRTWAAVANPNRATLTGVSFATLTAPSSGWAVGHDALILRSTDAGRTWTKQYQGENLQDSFLDVLALDAQRVIAVGAYGFFVITTNGGRTWTRRKINDDDYHFNRITRGPSGTLYLAGEHGTLLRSVDAGDTWSSISTPYEGSFYGVLPLDRRTLLAYGLRGHVFRSIDDGASWEPIATPQPAMLATAVKLKSNHVVIAGQAGTLLLSRDYGKSFENAPAAPASGIAELIELAGGELLTLGEAGVVVLPKP